MARKFTSVLSTGSTVELSNRKIHWYLDEPPRKTLKINVSFRTTDAHNSGFGSMVAEEYILIFIPDLLYHKSYGSNVGVRNRDNLFFNSSHQQS
jgi:hypothetical protein